MVLRPTRLFVLSLLFGLGVTSACSPAPVDEGPTDADADGVPAETDCDDNNKDINPSATEICDDLDNNCDGQIDEGVTHTYYADLDDDRFGDPDAPLEACQVAAGLVDNELDCNDSDDEINPNGLETCNDTDDDCSGEADEPFDQDGDGYTTCEDDCDDKDKAIHPGAKETCDGEDDNCDGKLGTSSIDEGDSDSDGTVNCQDCAPQDPKIHPGVKELCDGVDNNCSGTIDEGVSTSYCLDGDGDGRGDPAAIIPVCDTAPAGYVTACDDCDDGDPTIYPGATEICDGKDDNCDKSVPKEENQDQDKDSYPKCIDCDDQDAAVHPGLTDLCDGVDNDCDGQSDEDDTSLDLEPNGTLETALPLGTLDSTTVECADSEGQLLGTSDVDYYGFDSIDQVTDNWRMTASLVVPTGGEYCVTILNAKGEEMPALPGKNCASDGDTAVYEVGYVTYQATGSYFVKVYAEASSSCGAYKLTTCGY